MEDNFTGPDGEVYASKEAYFEETIINIRSLIQEKQTYINALTEALKECKKVFEQLNGDSITSLNYMVGLSRKITDLIGDIKND